MTSTTSNAATSSSSPWSRTSTSRDDVDAAMRAGCGFPMGPLELLDLIGLDTSLAVLKALDRERRDKACVPAPLLTRMVSAGLLGRKSGEGFYAYSPNGH